MALIRTDAVILIDFSSAVDVTCSVEADWGVTFSIILRFISAHSRTSIVLAKGEVFTVVPRVVLRMAAIYVLCFLPTGDRALHVNHVFVLSSCFVVQEY